MTKSVVVVLLAVSIGVFYGYSRRGGSKDITSDSSGSSSLDGEYRIVSAEYSGEKFSKEAIDRRPETERRFVIEDGKLKQFRGDAVFRNVLKVDLSKVPPEFDMYDLGGKVIGLGIVKVEGDTLTLCIDEGGPPLRVEADRRPGAVNPPPKRPTAFKTNSQTCNYIWVLQRQQMRR